MNKLDVIRSYYEGNMARGLPEYGILGWESEEAQQTRFDILLSKVDLEGKKLLDVGCGVGNLYEYIKSKNINVKYTGVDILDKMVEKARAKRLDADFINIDIFKNNIFEEKSFDIIYASGIFNLDLGNNTEFLANALDLFFRLSRETVVFNLLSVSSPNKEDRYFYFNPDEVAEILAGFSGLLAKTEFVESYLDNDFTVVCGVKRK
jgi:cyclopropane fatty-acyl-phospholipid synthase-like methyltransferase